MFRNRKDETAALTDHGRWISRLRDDFRTLNQRLRGLERRVSTMEENLVELTKLYSGLDLALSKLDDEAKLCARRSKAWVASTLW